MRTMKLANEDLEYRRPVWEALSDLFLDTDISLTRSWRIGILAASPYSIEELQEILVDEICPVCYSNLFCVAGEWAAFDPDWLESSILSRLRSPFPRWWRLSLGLFTVHLFWEWRHTKVGVMQQRSQNHAHNVA